MSKRYFILSVIALIGFIVIISCNKAKLDERAQTISIIPTAQGWEVYSKDKELLLELTKDNTDSLSLETLNYIYENSKESSGIDEDEYRQDVIKKVQFKQIKGFTSVNIALQK
jgi:hypothetical protein